MIVIVCINKDIALIVDFNKQQILSIIDNDSGLITHLTQIFNIYECYSCVDYNSSRNNYIQIPNCDLLTETYLHRIILRYYSEYDTKLQECLNNKNYEVNHKNKLRFDNRIDNLEIVTKLGNKQHQHYKIYDDQIIIKSEYIKQIQRDLKKQPFYTSKRKYLEKSNRYNWSFLQDYEFDKQNEKFFKCKYIKFRNEETIHIFNLSNYIHINTLIDLENTIFQYIKSTNTKLLSDSNYNIIVDYTKYRYRILTNNYLKVLFENINKYKYRYLKEVLINYKLLDINNIPTKFTDFKDRDKNRIIELISYKNRKGGTNNHPYKIYLNNILCTTPIMYELPSVIFDDKKSLFIGKYNSVRCLYFLGLLTRLKQSKLSIEYINKLSLVKRIDKIRNIKTPNYFTIPKLTNEILDKANIRAKKLLKFGINKITYFILAENFNVDVANEVYKSNNSKKYYIQCKKALRIINTTIQSLYNTRIKSRGYIKLDDIYNSICNISHYFKMLNLNNSDFPKNFKEFISTCINYIPSTKLLLKDLELKVVYLSNEIIDKIYKYQTENTDLVINQELKVKQKIIVLKKITK